MSTRALVGGLVIGLAAVGFAWAIGVDPAHALLVGAVLITLLGYRQLSKLDDDLEWPPLEEDRRDKGARRDVARLSWALAGYESSVNFSTVRRLRMVTDARLARHGLALDRPDDLPSCRALLGDDALAVLQADRSQRISYQAFLAAVQAVENVPVPHHALARS